MSSDTEKLRNGRLDGITNSIQHGEHRSMTRVISGELSVRTSKRTMTLTSSSAREAGKTEREAHNYAIQEIKKDLKDEEYQDQIRKNLEPTWMTSMSSS